MVDLYFDDFTEGQEFRSPAQTITEADVLEYADLCGDHHPLHVDAAFARNSIFGQRIAHGLLGLSIASGLMVRLGVFDVAGLAMLEVHWRFVRPIFLGDTVFCVTRIKEKRETSKFDRGIIVRDTKLVNQRGEVVQEGEIVTMCKRRTKKIRSL